MYEQAQQHGQSPYGAPGGTRTWTVNVGPDGQPILTPGEPQAQGQPGADRGTAGEELIALI